MLDLHVLLSKESGSQRKIIDEINRYLSNLKAEDRVKWAIDNVSGNHALTSSFGIQSAVCLHMYSTIKPDIPVILIDTGYLFPETYTFIEEMKNRLDINLKVFRPELSPAWQESCYGKLWEQGIEGIKKYNRINKVLPMISALEQLDLSMWHSGLRKSQSDTRADFDFLSIQGNRLKFLPILDWSEEDVREYFDKNQLDYHPLYYKGYVSLGDIHTTVPLEEGMKVQDTRFYGLKRECGLHDDTISKEVQVDMSTFFKEDE